MRGRCNGIGAWVFNFVMNGVILLTGGGYSGCDGSEVKFVAGGSCSFGLGGNDKKGKELSQCGLECMILLVGVRKERGVLTREREGQPQHPTSHSRFGSNLC
ncbi:elongation of fatty acids protein 3-like [Prunus yedoensis var. nudiflora]|uniref:Elongation of fatty acids protein 3-like n=1 Tax=Prunus yedoensis var. nudiflora TaxID=2094558 RepID=A0A314YWX2_PRUYE|nr:elongation of fatty acids protein 3-like [Prunus yedoensis var. nudiflora]